MSSSHRGECAEPVGGQLAWIQLRITVPTGVHTCVHTHTHTHTHTAIFSEWGTPPTHHPSRRSPRAPPVLPQVPVFPFFPHICEARQSCLWEAELCPEVSARAFQALVFRIYLKIRSGLVTICLRACSTFSSPLRWG